MFKRTAYATAIAALIGTGLVNAFPAGAQERTSDITTATSDTGSSQIAEMMGAGYGHMISDGHMDPYMETDHNEMMSYGPMGSHLADMNNADHTSLMGGDYSNMMTGGFDHDPTGITDRAGTPGNGPMSGR